MPIPNTLSNSCSETVDAVPSHMKLSDYNDQPVVDAPSAVRWSLRNHIRTPAKIRGLLYRGDVFQSILIRDISAGGAGLLCGNCVQKNDEVILRLLNGRGIQATVRWWLGGVCGVQFAVLLNSHDPLLTGKLDYFDDRDGSKHLQADFA